LVCASTSGLGAATGEALAAEGCRVIFAGRRAELADQKARQYPGCVGLGADLSTVDGALSLHAAAVQAVGPPSGGPILRRWGTGSRADLSLMGMRGCGP